jgi:hypothetical protein
MRGAPEGHLDALAALLASPARSGAYITRAELINLARLADGSLRVGERRRMLADVLKSAGSAEALTAVVERLKDFWRASVAEYEDLAASSEAGARAMGPWIDRAQATLRRLDEVVEELSL